MRLYFTPAKYLKMSAAFWLCRIVIGSFSKKLRDKLQWGCHMLQLVAVALRKVEAASTFSATCNTIFCCETSCKHGVSHEEVFLATCNATPLRCKLQGILPHVTWPLVMLKVNTKKLEVSLLGILFLSWLILKCCCISDVISTHKQHAYHIDIYFRFLKS